MKTGKPVRESRKRVVTRSALASIVKDLESMVESLSRHAERLPKSGVLIDGSQSAAKGLAALRRFRGNLVKAHDATE